MKKILLIILVLLINCNFVYSKKTIEYFFAKRSICDFRGTRGIIVKDIVSVSKNKNITLKEFITKVNKKYFQKNIAIAYSDTSLFAIYQEDVVGEPSYNNDSTLITGVWYKYKYNKKYDFEISVCLTPDKYFKPDNEMTQEKINKIYEKILNFKLSDLQIFQFLYINPIPVPDAKEE